LLCDPVTHVFFFAAIKSQFVFEGPAPLDVQFKSFLSQVLLTQEQCGSLISRILQDLEPCLTQEFHRCQPYVFGSMATGLALVGSDVDIYLDTGEFKPKMLCPVFFRHSRNIRNSFVINYSV